MSSPVKLTRREIDVLKLTCEDISTKNIAGKLFVSPKTVEYHRCNLYKKTSSNSMIGLFRWAILNGFVTVTNERSHTTNGKTKRSPRAHR